MRRTFLGLTALLAVCVSLLPDAVEAGRRKRCCCQPCYAPCYAPSCAAPAAPPALATTALLNCNQFCAQMKMMTYVDGSGTTRYMYSGNNCDPSQSPCYVCSSGGLDTSLSLNYPAACGSAGCTGSSDEERPASSRNGELAPRPLTGAVKNLNRPPENGVQQDGPHYVTFKNTKGKPIHIELHHLWTVAGGVIQNEIALGFEVDHPGPGEGVPDNGNVIYRPGTEWVYYFYYQGVSYKVVTTTP